MSPEYGQFGPKPPTRDSTFSWLKQYFPFFEHLVDQGIRVIALLGEDFRRADNHIDGQDETLGNRPTNRIAALWPSCVCTKHDQQTHIAVRSNLAASEHGGRRE